MRPEQDKRGELPRISPTGQLVTDLVEFFWSLPPAEREKQFVSTSQAARKIGISQRTVQVWIDLGEIRAIKVGKNYKVLLASLKNIISANQGA